MMNTDLLPRDGRILCAVSGGPDSMYLLERLRELGYRVAAAHFEHGLRGEESLNDASFVRSWCEEHDIPFFAGSGDTAAWAGEQRLGVEEAARMLRYDFLEHAADEWKADVIATAHTADDNAETVLMHLTRGTGLRGLGGIPPVRGRIVRPMLDTTRDEVLRYLAERRIPFQEDATNAEDDCMRNRIRHHVVPALRRENPAFTGAVCRMAGLLREDEEYLTELAERFLEDNCAEDGTLPAYRLSELPAPVARRVIRLAAGPVPREQTDRILALARCGGTADVSGMRVAVSSGRIAFDAAEGQTLPERLLRPGEDILLPEAGLGVRCEKISSYPGDVNKSFNTFLFSCENIDGMVTVGTRRPGDRYRPLGRGCTKTLKMLFLENRVPRWRRSTVPVLRDKTGIVGVYGMPPAERTAAGPEDKDILRIDFFRLAPEREG